MSDVRSRLQAAQLKKPPNFLIVHMVRPTYGLVIGAKQS